MTTKAAQIMALHQQGKTTREIALEVYGEATASQLAYVRIVVYQRKGTGVSPADRRYVGAHRAEINANASRRWQQAPLEYKKAVGIKSAERFRKRYKSDPEFRAAKRARNLAYVRTEHGRATKKNYMREYMRNRRAMAVADSAQIS